MSRPKLFSVDELFEYSTGVLKKVGLSEADASIVADTILSAELRGIFSHGMVRIPQYIARIEEGTMDKDAIIEVEKDSKAIALINANNGFGQLAGYKAMSLAISKAKEYGIGFVAVKNSNHFGITSYYSMMAEKEDMIGMVYSNASPAIAPYGTKDKLLGTNPLSYAIPANKFPAIVLDMACSVVARGKIRFHAMLGKDIPEGWALDADGRPTTDAQKALKGSLVPIGGVKGSGLSLVVDLMTGVLTNTCLTGEVLTLTDPSGPSKTAHIFCAINISKFIDPDFFKSNVDLVIERIKNMPSIDGNPVYMPGEIEYNLTQKRKEEGIPLEEKLVESLNSLAERYGAPGLSS
jgi:LDH2 family malate/lactate/ureidoglycolate dehydrogenase